MTLKFNGFKAKRNFHTILTCSATHAHLGVLGIEVTACVTILDRITRRPPARGARLHTGREAPKSSIRAMQDGPPTERSLRGQAVRHSRSK